MSNTCLSSPIHTCLAQWNFYKLTTKLDGRVLDMQDPIQM